MFTIIVARCQNKGCTVETFNFADCNAPICPACKDCAKHSVNIEECGAECESGQCPYEDCAECGKPMCEHDDGECPTKIRED